MIFDYIFWGAALRFSFLHFGVRVRGMVRGVRMGHGMGNAASETAPDCRRRQDPSEFATVRQIAWCTVPRIDLNLQLSGNTCERMHDAMHDATHVVFGLMRSAEIECLNRFEERNRCTTQCTLQCTRCLV